MNFIAHPTRKFGAHYSQRRAIRNKYESEKGECKRDETICGGKQVQLFRQCNLHFHNFFYDALYFSSVQTAALIYTTMMFHHTIYRAMSDVIWMEK